MNVSHQYVASNFDPSKLKGLLAVDAYNKASYKGFGDFTFDDQTNLKMHIPVIKEFFKDYEDRFSCKATIETGIVYEELDYKSNK